MFWWFRVVVLPLKRVIMGDNYTGFRVQGIYSGVWRIFESILG